MYYYKIEEDLVTKYNVELNQEELKKLREEIIVNCSLIEHVEKKDMGLINYDSDNIRNLKREKIGEVQSSLSHIPAERIYLVEYDKYYYPELVSLIDSLLSGNLSVIDKIQNPNFDELEKKQKLSVMNEIESILENSNKLDSYKQAELINLNQQKLLKISSSREYYSKVFKYIVFEKKAQLPLEYLEETLNFFNDTTKENTINNEVNKVLLKQNIKLNNE